MAEEDPIAQLRDTMENVRQAQAEVSLDTDLMGYDAKTTQINQTFLEDPLNGMAI